MVLNHTPISYSVDLTLRFWSQALMARLASCVSISTDVSLGIQLTMFHVSWSADTLFQKSPCILFRGHWVVYLGLVGIEVKRVITYGTFDLLHYGHINLLRRAKQYGDYLIVALSTDDFNWNQKKKKCYFSFDKRKALLEAIRYVDLVIPEESWDQKVTDVREYHIDTFVMGDDWKGEFDFLQDEGVDVVYLPRTPEVSTTQIKRDLKS